MKSVIIIGAGHIGTVIAEELSGTGNYHITLADNDTGRLARLHLPDVDLMQLDVQDVKALHAALSGREIVISACPFFLNVSIAEAAKVCGVHYFDLTEDIGVARRVAELADGARTVFVPQCGVAPGAINIIGHHMAVGFDKTISVQLRVGALPLFPTNALKYNLTWSTHGLINEYCNPCEALQGGREVELLPLEGLEIFSFDGIDYEAFNTSGGLGTLSESLKGRVETLNYKTVRYPGHRDIIQLLLHDLRLREDRDTLHRVFEHSIPETDQDVVIMFVSAIGHQGGRLRQKTFSVKIYGDERHSAIQICTSAGVCAMVDLFVAGKIPQSGFVRQEDCRLPDFLANRFGCVFQPEPPKSGRLKRKRAGTAGNGGMRKLSEENSGEVEEMAE
jgi:saccharopine dehydrogenase-like NADP-dependent oxidoreductase